MATSPLVETTSPRPGASRRCCGTPLAELLDQARRTRLTLAQRQPGRQHDTARQVAYSIRQGRMARTRSPVRGARGSAHGHGPPRMIWLSVNTIG